MNLPNRKTYNLYKQADLNIIGESLRGPRRLYNMPLYPFPLYPELVDVLSVINKKGDFVVVNTIDMEYFEELVNRGEVRRI